MLRIERAVVFLTVVSMAVSTCPMRDVGSQSKSKIYVREIYTPTPTATPTPTVSPTPTCTPTSVPPCEATSTPAPTAAVTSPNNYSIPETSNLETGNVTSTFTVTAYCPCEKCCGVGGGHTTASGTTPTAGRTIAADTSVLPMGTHVLIEGHEYVVEDRGGAIKGNRIDMFMSSHQEALNWGKRTVEVTIID